MSLWYTMIPAWLPARTLASAHSGASKEPGHFGVCLAGTLMMSLWFTQMTCLAARQELFLRHQAVFVHVEAAEDLSRLLLGKVLGQS